MPDQASRRRTTILVGLLAASTLASSAFVASAQGHAANRREATGTSLSKAGSRSAGSKGARPNLLAGLVEDIGGTGTPSSGADGAGLDASSGSDGNVSDGSASAASSGPDGQPSGILPGLFGTTTTPPGPTTTLPTSPTTTAPTVTVTDPKASDGTAISASGPVSAPCGCAAGAWSLTVRARGTGSRVWLTVDGARVGEYALNTDYRTLPAEIWIPAANARVGVTPVPAYQGAAIQTAFIDSIDVTPSTPGFTVRGNQIIHRLGFSAVFRGVNKGSFEYSRYGEQMTEEDAHWVEGWGATMVRLPVSEQFALPFSCHYDPGYLDRVGQEIALLNTHGLYVLLDNHFSMAGNPCLPKPDNLKAADDFAVEFWKLAAAKFKDNPLVAFDLYNEPHYISDQLWRNGGLIDGYHTPGMQALYDAVRSTGAKNLVVATGNTWGNDLRVALSMPLDGYAIVYGAHAYCYSCARDDAVPRFLDAYVAPTAAKYPTIMSEFGDYKQDLGRYNKDLIAWAEAHGMGWLAYNFHPAPVSDLGMLQDYGNWNPNTAGQSVRDALWAARGWRNYFG